MKRIFSNFKRARLILCLLTAMIFTPAYNFSQTLASDPLYKLVFADEFDSLGVDLNKWQIRWPWGPNLFNDSIVTDICGANPIDVAYNYYPPSGNINQNRYFDTTGSGFQRLISKRENITGQVFNYGPGGFINTIPRQFKYSTAMLYSRYNFKYAYIEMRFRTSGTNNPLTNTFNAYGPNLWMYTSNPSDSAFHSEIDIFEMDGTDWSARPCSHYRKRGQGSPTAFPDDTAFFHGNSYTPNYYAPYLRKPFFPFTPGNWHTVGCEWTPEYTDFYYDGLDTVQRFSVSKYPANRLTSMPLIIDCYVPAFQYCRFVDTVNTQLPFNYDIDYIKVYQIKQNCIPAIFLITNAPTYQSTLYQDLTIGGVGGNAIFSSGSTHLAGQNFVLLDEGFEASGPATVIVSTPKCQNGQSIIYNLSTLPQPFPPQAPNDIKTSKTNE